MWHVLLHILLHPWRKREIREARERRDELLIAGKPVPWTLDVKWWQAFLVVLAIVAFATLATYIRVTCRDAMAASERG